MSQSFENIHGKSDVLLSNLQAAAPDLREYFTENGPLTSIPLVSRTAKKIDDTITHAYIISYEAFLLLRQTLPSISLAETKTLNDFAQNARQTTQNEQGAFWNTGQDAQIVMMGARKGHAGTCFVVISPKLESKFRNTQLNKSKLFSPSTKTNYRAPIQDPYSDHSASGFRQGKGLHVSTSAIRKGDKSSITNRTDNGEIVWLGDKTIAAVSHKNGEELCRLLSNSCVMEVKEISAKQLASAHGQIFEDIRRNNVMYRVDNREISRERELFTIIPDHATRFMQIDGNGLITGFREPTSQEFCTSTQAWVYKNFDHTKIIFTENPEKVENQIRISMSDEQRNLIDRILGLGLADEASIQGIKFSCLGEQVMQRNWRPKGLITAESINIRSTFDVNGRTSNVIIEATQRPHLTQLIAEQSTLLVIQSGGREYTLTP